MPERKRSSKRAEDQRNNPTGCAVDIAIVLLPLALWLLCTLLLFPARPISFVVLGCVGAPVLGFSLSGLRYLQKRGEKLRDITGLEGVPLVLGTVMIVSSAAALYLIHDGNVRTHYFIGLILLLIDIMFSYPYFRFAVDEKLRRNRVSKSRIKKLKRGRKNYWLLSALHRECGIGIAYPLNAAFVVLFPTALTMQLLLGWWSPFILPVGIIVTLTMSLGTVMQIVTMKRTVHSDWRSLLGSFCIMLMTAAGAWTEMRLTLDVVAGKTVYR